MQRKLFAQTIFAATLFLLVTPVFTGTVPVFKDSFEALPPSLTGRILLTLTMPIPEEDRAAVLENKALLEAEGLSVAEDGSSVIFPNSSIAGWLIRFGPVETFAEADGSFTLNLGGVSGDTGSVYHPSHEDDVAIGSFSRDDLVTEGETPVPIVLELPFDGPCDMTVGPDNPAHCQVVKDTGLGSDHVILASPAGHDRYLPLDTYPPTPRESACQILDGWIDSNTSPLGSYFGSTCFNRVLSGMCPNEGGFGIFASEICCFKNHKGRFCQEVTPGDMKLLDLPTENWVVLDDETEFTVHSNSNWGETFVIPWLAKGIGGEIPVHSSYYDGEGGSIKHFEEDLLAAYSCATNTPSQGADIYVADRTVIYKTPRCLSKPPAAEAKDQYRIHSRDWRSDFVLTFQLHQGFLWQFEGGGAVFDLGQALELRGSRLSEPEPIEEDRGCAGQHIHGSHPCTGAPDPEPMKCGHGIVTPLAAD